MSRKVGSYSIRSSFGGKKGAGTKRLISSLSGVSVRAPKINKGTNRQRIIKGF